MVKYNPVHPHCGPFNSISKYPPSDPVDRICWIHDKAYKQYGKLGYFLPNEADREFIKQMGLQKGLLPSMYKKVFQIKQWMWRGQNFDYMFKNKNPRKKKKTKRLTDAELRTKKMSGVKRTRDFFVQEQKDDFVPPLPTNVVKKRKVPKKVHFDKDNTKSKAMAKKRIRVRMRKRKRSKSRFRRKRKFSKKRRKYGRKKRSLMNLLKTHILSPSKWYRWDQVKIATAAYNDSHHVFVPFFTNSIMDNIHDEYCTAIGVSTVDQREIMTAKRKARFTFCNNATYRQRVTIYSVYQKNTCVQADPLTKGNAIKTAEGTTNEIASTDPMFDYRQMKSFRYIYKCYTLFSGWLDSGEQKSVVVNSFREKLLYGDADVANSYLRKGYCGGIMVRVVGQNIHDVTTSTLVGTSNIALDCTYYLSCQVFKAIRSIQYKLKSDAAGQGFSAIGTGETANDVDMKPDDE